MRCATATEEHDGVAVRGQKKIPQPTRFVDRRHHLATVDHLASAALLRQRSGDIIAAVSSTGAPSSKGRRLAEEEEGQLSCFGELTGDEHGARAPSAAAESAAGADASVRDAQALLMPAGQS